MMQPTPWQIARAWIQFLEALFGDPSPADEPGYIYCFRLGPFWKVGRSRNWRRRRYQWNYQCRRRYIWMAHPVFTRFSHKLGASASTKSCIDLTNRDRAIGTPGAGDDSSASALSLHRLWVSNFLRTSCSNFAGGRTHIEVFDFRGFNGDAWNDIIRPLIVHLNAILIEMYGL